MFVGRAGVRMEQAISKLPRSSKFHSTSSDPQLIPARRRLDFLSKSCGRSGGGSSSVDGGRSWEERFLDLSVELQQICGSPLTSPCNALAGSADPPLLLTVSTSSAVGVSPSSPRLTATSPHALSSSAASASWVPVVPDQRSGQWWTTDPPLLTRSLGRCTDATCGAELVRRAISLQDRQRTEAVSGGHGEGGARPRPITVRHEETHETLAERLSAICGKSSQTAAAAAVDHHPNTSSPEELPIASKLRATNATAGSQGRSAVMIKVDVAPYCPEDIVAAVYDGRLLTIDAYEGSTTCRLHSAELPSAVADCLLCRINSSGSAYVLERPRGTGLSVEFTGTNSVFLPIIHCDEDQLVVTLVLRVPDDFRFDELAVKTVDSSVWITGNGKRDTSPVPAASCEACSSRLSDGARRRFKVVIPLPNGCDSRSVVAVLSSNNQLVLKAKLTAACRRYTF